MDYRKIEILVDKYFEAETTLMEEKELKAFYASNASLPPQLEQYRKHFQYLSTSFQDVKISEDFEQKLKMQIAQLESSEKQEGQQQKNKGGIIRFIQPIFAVAAMLTIMAFAGRYYQTTILNANEQTAYVVINNEEIKDPQKAYEIMKASLGVVSKNMKKGKKELRHMKQFEKTRKLIKGK